MRFIYMLSPLCYLRYSIISIAEGRVIDMEWEDEVQPEENV